MVSTILIVIGAVFVAIGLAGIAHRLLRRSRAKAPSGASE